jgi:UDP-glucose 4-epimerase
MKKILVTGGAGYIGSHAVRALCDAGYEATVVDNLSKGHEGAVDGRAEFVELDLGDFEGLRKLLEDEKFDAVMHFAGSIEVGLSMREPALFFDNNVVNGRNLLEAMRLNGVDKIIFSSTAAVYGDPEHIPIKENDSLKPTNFYGVTKLMFENLLKKHDEFWDIKYIALRYFNACGADESGEIGQDYSPDTHLIPRMLKTLQGKYSSLRVFGTDYETPDGTCIRDYIHVTDLVDAHLKALEYLFKGGISNVFNLGNGNGFSVEEVIEKTESVTGKKVPYEEVERREGDPARLVADSEKARKILGWNPSRQKLEDIIGSAWRWHSNKPEGY